jgi:anaerobic dimethyl sulfoxide reductase subunit B (iron-sulfur subunit)
MASQLGFYFDQTVCTGCKACQIACKDKYDTPLGVNYRRVVEYSGGSWSQEGRVYAPKIFAYYLSVSCNHCADAPCVSVCPTTAMARRDDGTVWVDESKCVGCRYCEWVCPYGAPQLNPETGHIGKCDLCWDYRQTGQTPACVAACPSRALDWGPVDELRAKYGEGQVTAPLPDPALTQPNLVVKPHRDAQPWDEASGQIVNPKEL